MLTVFFTDAPRVTDYAEAKTSDTARFGRWFRALLDSGVYWPPSQFEAAFLSAVMTDDGHRLSCWKKRSRHFTRCTSA